MGWCRRRAGGSSVPGSGAADMPVPSPVRSSVRCGPKRTGLSAGGRRGPAGASCMPCSKLPTAPRSLAPTTSGTVQGAWHHGVARFAGIPYAAPRVGRSALPAAGPGPSRGTADARHADDFGPISPAEPVADRRVVRRREPSRGARTASYLNVWTPEPRTPSRPAGDGVDPRRRVRDGVRVVAAVPRRVVRPVRRGAGVHQLPPRRVRVPRARRRWTRSYARVRQRRPARPGRRARVGARQHRGLRRRRRQRHDLRRVRRGHERLAAAGDARRPAGCSTGPSPSRAPRRQPARSRPPPTTRPSSCDRGRSLDDRGRVGAHRSRRCWPRTARWLRHASRSPRPSSRRTGNPMAFLAVPTGRRRQRRPGRSAGRGRSRCRRPGCRSLIGTNPRSGSCSRS